LSRNSSFIANIPASDAYHYPFGLAGGINAAKTDDSMKPRQTSLSQQTHQAAVRAFSLVELMISVLVMAIIFVVLFAGISSTFGIIDVTRENLRATQVLVSRLEGLRLCAWSNAQLFNPSVVPPTFTDTFYPLGLNGTTNFGTTYTGTITVSTNFALNPPATYSNHLAMITMTVTWTTTRGSATTVHTRSMNTYVAQYGLQNYVSAQ
jgi:type II secretory pathway pseudopilin PulG